MTKVTQILQVPARKAGAALPGALAVGQAVLELHTERTPNGGSHSRRLAARWTNGRAEGDAFVELRPASKVLTEITVSLERPKGARGLLWPKPALRRLGNLFAQALAYEISTRHIEEADAFGVRRTSAELVKARTA
jgi:hypothetical protein